MGSGMFGGGGLFGSIGNIAADAYEGVTGVHSAKTRREGRRKKAEGKLTTKMFGDNLIKSKADEERMGKLEGDMQSKLALAPGALQRGAAEAGALSMGRANMSGPGSLAAFRDVGVKGLDAKSKGDIDLATANMAMARGKQTDETENYTMVSNALENAKRSGAGKNAIARIAGMARGQAARAMAENAMATYQDPKKASLSGDLSGILKYATT